MKSFNNRKCLLFLIIFFSIGSNCYAEDHERIDLLEERVTELEEGLAKIQILLLAIAGGIENNTEVSEEETILNEELKKKWRSLATDMSPKQVRSILGEPEKLDGGNVAMWYYSQNGRVTFIDDKVRSWNEPDF